MKDANGKAIKVGSYVRTPEGGVVRVAAILSVSDAHHAGQVEVLSAKEATASKAADGDSIIWGS